MCERGKEFGRALVCLAVSGWCFAVGGGLLVFLAVSGGLFVVSSCCGLLVVSLVMVVVVLLPCLGICTGTIP